MKNSTKALIKFWIKAIIALATFGTVLNFIDTNVTVTFASVSLTIASVIVWIVIVAIIWQQYASEVMFINEK